MAVIRNVLQNTNTEKWAYIEYSDEDEKTFTILGNTEFETEPEAQDFAKGFAPDSYEYIEPKEVKIKIIEKEIVKTEERLIFLRERLLEVQSEEQAANLKKK